MKRSLLFAVVMAFFAACSPDNKGVAGGTTEDSGIVAELNVAGVVQKGPFVKGSVVTVQGVDCKTMVKADEKFEFQILSDKGDFEIGNLSLSSTCALFEVTGYYLSELTGERSSEKVTLRTLTNFKDRKTVNVNVLTNLEYGRVVNLVSEKKMSFAKAKEQAEKEVLASFGIAGSADESEQFEDLNIFEKGEGNTALLAVSVLTLASAGETNFADRLDQFSAEISENGTVGDSAKAEIAGWATSAAASGTLDSIRKNVESWGYADEVPAFEEVVEKIADCIEYDNGSDGQSGDTLFLSLPCNIDGMDACEYDTFTDERDGKVYKTVKIGKQVWMAENLNYADSVKTPSLLRSSWCYDNDPANCATMDRLYTWMAAIDSTKLATDKDDPKICGYGMACGLTKRVQGICPEGYHLPDTTDWNLLITAVGGWDNAGKMLKSQSAEWLYSPGSDYFGFSALPGGFRYRSSSFDAVGGSAYFWASTEKSEEDVYHAYSICMGHIAIDSFSDGFKDNGFSVRCVKD